jgi:hypothetical protein
MGARYSVGIHNHPACDPYRTSAVVLSRHEFYLQLSAVLSIYIFRWQAQMPGRSQNLSSSGGLLMTAVLVPRQALCDTSKMLLSIHSITFLCTVDQLYTLFTISVMSLALIRLFYSAHRNKLFWKISYSKEFPRYIDAFGRAVLDLRFNNMTACEF